MFKTLFFWFLAFLIMAVAAIYQRKTGPTYPIDGSTEVASAAVQYQLTRTHGGEGDQEVPVLAKDASVRGDITYRRFKSYDSWTTAPLTRRGDTLIGTLPHQPMAGKIEYFLQLHRENATVRIPSDGLVITRFKGHVPLVILIPHVIAMLLVMLLSAMTAFEALRKGRDPRRLATMTLITIVIGGFILGPLVQKYAFDVYWSGVPFGFDLTDNKTLIALIAWLVAVLFLRRTGNTPMARRIAVAAAVVTLAVFMIPHSVLGSEIDHRKTSPAPQTSMSTVMQSHVVSRTCMR